MYQVHFRAGFLGKSVKSTRSLRLVMLIAIFDNIVITYLKKNTSLLLSVSSLAVWGTILLVTRLYWMGNKPPSFSNSDNPAADSHSLLTRTLTFFYLPSVNMWLLLCPNTLSFDWSMDAVPLLRNVGDWRNLHTVAFYVGLLLLAWVSLRSPSRVEETNGKAYVMNGKHTGTNGKHTGTNGHSCHPDMGLPNSESRPVKSTENGIKNHVIPRTPLPTTKNIVVFSLGLLTVPFLPATNLFFYVGFVIAERVLYIPSMGFCLLVTVGMRALYIKFRRRFLKSLLLYCTATLVLLYGIKTVLRNQDWQDEEMLYKSGINVNPAKAWGNLGNVLKSQGKMAEAEKAYRNALYYRSNMADMLYNLGLLLQENKRFSQALHYYKLAIGSRPTLASAYLNTGIILMNEGRLDEARRTFLMCAEIPDENLKDPHAHKSSVTSCLYNLGKLFHERGQHEEALSAYKEAILKMPRQFAPQSLYNMMGEAYMRLNKLTEAEHWYRESLRAKPDHIPAHLTYGKLLALICKTRRGRGTMCSPVPAVQIPGGEESLVHSSAGSTDPRRGRKALCTPVLAVQIPGGEESLVHSSAGSSDPGRGRRALCTPVLAVQIPGGEGSLVHSSAGSSDPRRGGEPCALQCWQYRSQEGEESLVHSSAGSSDPGRGGEPCALQCWQFRSRGGRRALCTPVLAVQIPGGEESLVHSSAGSSDPRRGRRALCTPVQAVQIPGGGGEPCAPQCWQFRSREGRGALCTPVLAVQIPGGEESLVHSSAGSTDPRRGRRALCTPVLAVQIPGGQFLLEQSRLLEAAEMAGKAAQLDSTEFDVVFNAAHMLRLTVQPPQSYIFGGQCSSGKLTGKPAGARPDYRGHWCMRTVFQVAALGPRGDGLQRWVAEGPVHQWLMGRELQAIGHSTPIDPPTCSDWKKEFKAEEIVNKVQFGRELDGIIQGQPNPIYLQEASRIHRDGPYATNVKAQVTLSLMNCPNQWFHVWNEQSAESTLLNSFFYRTWRTTSLENTIQFINCQDLEDLCALLLNRNQLTSIHGLDGVTNLRVLELSHNSITRIGGTLEHVMESLDSVPFYNKTSPKCVQAYNLQSNDHQGRLERASTCEDQNSSYGFAKSDGNTLHTELSKSLDSCCSLKVSPATPGGQDKVDLQTAGRTGESVSENPLSRRVHSEQFVDHSFKWFSGFFVHDPPRHLHVHGVLSSFTTK
ncbi:Transmembrane and TPR repeat-containing protein 2 [Acipenser ruthenus]|uniref:dolichyl-phosphate-mannose--protein mannosyltransferase n=1 Tax=Acipenser ruthenus TaxID=7906 RepID=A0A444UN83_ACIRT|nr:Transmembrane and TPR repeat-containing protein 2 [Acipenser ruthenus]